MNRLQQSMNKFNTDKNSKCHDYGRQYYEIFKKFENKNIKILELGVYKGESLKVYPDFFGSDCTVIGVDIDVNCKNYENINHNIFVEILDLSKPESYSFLKTKYDSFDLIIDDASHKFNDMVFSFENLFQFLNEDGVYIVEDTCVWNDQAYNNTENNILNYFFEYTKFLNKYKVDINNDSQYISADPFKQNIKTANFFEYSIDQITFGCSFIAINKKTRYHWI